MVSLSSDPYVPDIAADTRTEVDRKWETFGLSQMFGLDVGVWLHLNLSTQAQTRSLHNNTALRLELLYQ